MNIVSPVLEIDASPLALLDKLVVVELNLVLEIHAANDVMNFISMWWWNFIIEKPQDIHTFGH